MDKQSQMLNHELEFMTRANSNLNPFAPKSGVLLIGENGIEFRSEKSPGFIQIPWTSISQVRVQMFFKGKYVRGFFIESNEKQTFEFIVSDAKETLKSMRQHLERKQFIVNPSNVMGIFRRRNKNT